MILSTTQKNKIKEKMSDILSKDKNKKIIVLSGLIGILLIFVSGLFKDTSGDPVKIQEAKIDSQKYIDNLQQSIENIVCNIKGAGNSKVLITLENGTETVYATEERKNKEASEDRSNGETTRKKESNDCEKKYITVKDSEGTEHALAVTEIQPKIKGVIVVCKGGDNPIVQQRVINAITTALNISSNRVCVTKSNS